MPMEGEPAAAPPPPGRHHAHDTYIVQFPKDQVYRVPPRENALIVEQYRNPPIAKRKRRGCFCCLSRRVLLTLALVFVAIVAVAGISLAVLYFIFNPRVPMFAVSHVAVVSGSKTSRPQYEVSLMATNPNGKLRIEYEEGAVSLLFEETKVAAGKFPALEQGGDEASEVRVEVAGSSAALPRGNKGGNVPLDLRLVIKFALKIRTAGFQSWAIRSNVACQFQVSGLGNDTQLLSQQCHTKLNKY